MNLMRFLALVHEFREEAQLIIVSHQKRTMEAADTLYGVTMAPGGSSKVLSQKIPRQTRRDRGRRPACRFDQRWVRGHRRRGLGVRVRERPARTMCCTIRSATGWPEPSESAIPSRDRRRSFGRVRSRHRAGDRDSGCRRRRRDRGRRRPAPSALRLRHRGRSARGGPAASRTAPAAAPSAEIAEAVAPPEGVAPPEAVAPPEPVTYRSRLGKARGLLSGYLGSIRAKSRVDSATWDDLEEALIRADVGVKATDALLEDLRGRVKAGEITGPDALVDALKSDLVGMLASQDATLAVPDGAAEGTPVDVWLFVGVNGVGKTTTVGKVARRLSTDGSKVLHAAADTFRAAAGEQLETWASRTGADIVRGSEGGDPGSVVWTAVRTTSRGHAVVLADTAGRLHNKVNLIEELKKVRRVADRPPRARHRGTARPRRHDRPERPHPGQGLPRGGRGHRRRAHQARRHGQGRPRVAIERELGLPVKLVGLGEGVDDLVDFDPAAFVDTLLLTSGAFSAPETPNRSEVGPVA